jgi:hypothetical protein
VAVTATGWSFRREGRPAVLAAGLILLSSCALPDPTPPPPPTEDEAIAFLNELTALALAGNLEAMCDFAGDGNCEDFVDEAGGLVAVPEDPPVVAGTRLIPSQRQGEGWSVGGRVLVLCGTDGRQRPYRTEMLVSRNLGETYAINAVYWSGSNLAVSNDTGDPSGGAGIDCP